MIRDWVALNMTPGIGPRAAAKLLERFGSAEAVFGATRLELEQLRLLPEAVDSIIARELHDKAEAEIVGIELQLIAISEGDVFLHIHRKGGSGAINFKLPMFVQFR